MFYYFGYGSNMNEASLRAKGIHPVGFERAFLRDWRLVFNVPDFFTIEGGTGNIERSPGNEVHGGLYACSDEEVAVLDRLEALGVAYARQTLPVVTYSGESRQALVYIGIPGRLAIDHRPSPRYKNILVRGAEALGLKDDYIEYLKAIPTRAVRVNPLWVFPEVPARVFSEEDLSSTHMHTAFMGAVFDMSYARQEHRFLQGFFAGKDVTLFLLKRLETSEGNETWDDVYRCSFSERQREYLNDYLHEFNREYRYAGRMNYAAGWRQQPLAERGADRNMYRSVRVVPAAEVLKRAEETNRELKHENLGFLSRSHGLMPIEAPRSNMPAAYSTWDEIAAQLPELHRTLQLRHTLDQLPLLFADEDHLPDAYLLRAASILAMLSHAYYYVESRPPDGLPVALTQPWEAVRRRLGRTHQVLTYIDLIVYNWRLVDPDRENPRRVENMRLMIPTVNNPEENHFYLTQSEILGRCSPLIGLIVDAQQAVVDDDPETLKVALADMVAGLQKVVREGLPKINPHRNHRFHVDATVWAKTVAPFAVPFVQGVLGPSGTSSPIFNLLDEFFGRKKHDSFLGTEILQLRKGYPPFWREFIQAVGQISVHDYIQRTEDPELLGLYQDAASVYAGEQGFLGRHRMKVYGYLELAFKVGRSVTIGGFSGAFKDRTWDRVDSELEQSRVERSHGYARRCFLARIKSVGKTHPEAADGTRHVVLDVEGSGVRYEPGDRCGVMPENADDVVDQTLEALDMDGDAEVLLSPLWKAHVNFRAGYEAASSLPLKTFLRFAKLRPVANETARVLYRQAKCAPLKNALETAKVDQWELWELLRMLKRETHYRPTSLLSADPDAPEYLSRLIPPETFRMYSIASAMTRDHVMATEVHLTVGRLRYSRPPTDYVAGGLRAGTASRFLTENLDRREPLSIIIDHPPHFNLPPDPTTPIVMLAGGTGISPFRAFLQERMREPNAGDTYLFLGCTSREYFYYHGEMAQAVAEGRLRLQVAFSQEKTRVCFEHDEMGGHFRYEPGEAVYIDKVMIEEENAQALYNLLKSRERGGQGAWVYVCGRSRFANSVHRAFTEILSRFSEGTDEERHQAALQVIARMVGEGRYCQEVFRDARNPDRSESGYDVSEIIWHNDETRGFWQVIDGEVCDITDFMEMHPGGSLVLRGYAGMEASLGYRRAHGYSSQIDALREMYSIGRVRPLNFRGGDEESASPAPEEEEEALSRLYRGWVGLTYLVVEMQNALWNDQRLQTSITTRGEDAQERTLYKLQRAVETQERFLRSYLDVLQNDSLPTLWRETQAVCAPGADADWMATTLGEIQNRPEAQYVEQLVNILHDAVHAKIGANVEMNPPGRDKLLDAIDAISDLQRVTESLRQLSTTTRDWNDGLEAGRQIEQLTTDLRARLGALQEENADPTDPSSQPLVEVVALIEASDREFLTRLKTALADGLKLFEQHESQVIAMAGPELQQVLQQLPALIADYYAKIYTTSAQRWRQAA